MSGPRPPEQADREQHECRARDDDDRGDGCILDRRHGTGLRTDHGQLRKRGIDRARHDRGRYALGGGKLEQDVGA